MAQQHRPPGGPRPAQANPHSQPAHLDHAVDVVIDCVHGEVQRAQLGEVGDGVGARQRSSGAGRKTNQPAAGAAWTGTRHSRACASCINIGKPICELTTGGTPRHCTLPTRCMHKPHYVSITSQKQALLCSGRGSHAMPFLNPARSRKINCHSLCGWNNDA